MRISRENALGRVILWQANRMLRSYRYTPLSVDIKASARFWARQFVGFSVCIPLMCWMTGGWFGVCFLVPAAYAGFRFLTAIVLQIHLEQRESEAAAAADS